MEIIGLCQSPGLSRSGLVTKANVNSSKLMKILFGLIDDQLLRIETRKTSSAGLRRVTDYYLRTIEGDALIKDFQEVKERISTSGSQ